MAYASFEAELGGTMLESTSHTELKPPVNWAKRGSIAQWVGAVVTSVGVGVAIFALAVAWRNYEVAWKNYTDSLVEQKNKLSADAILAWSKQEPSNARPCTVLLQKLNTAQFQNMIDRQEFSIKSRDDKTPSLERDVRACFSDRDDIAKLLNDDGILTVRGVALLASKANAILDGDSFIASFIMQKIGNPSMYDRIREVICRDDDGIIKNLPKDERTLDSFVWLRKFLDAKYPDGCNGHPRFAKSPASP
jgi:hypothetical protein